MRPAVAPGVPPPSVAKVARDHAGSEAGAGRAGQAGRAGLACYTSITWPSCRTAGPMPHHVHPFGDVVSLLAARGHRVLLPYPRGAGPTRRSLSWTPRNGRRAVFARDTIALPDALRIEQAVLAGFDWEAGWV